MDIRGWFLPTSPPYWLTHWETAETFWLERFAAEPDGRSATLLVLTNGKRELNGHTWLVPADFTALLTDALGNDWDLLAGKIRCWTWWKERNTACPNIGKCELNGHTWLVLTSFNSRLVCFRYWTEIGSPCSKNLLKKQNTIWLPKTRTDFLLGLEGSYHISFFTGGRKCSQETTEEKVSIAYGAFEAHPIFFQRWNTLSGW